MKFASEASGKNLARAVVEFARIPATIEIWRISLQLNYTDKVCGATNVFTKSPSSEPVFKRYGQTLFLLFRHECWKINDFVAVQLQLPRTWHEHSDLASRDRHPRRSGKVSSRIGLEAKATTFNTSDNLLSMVEVPHKAAAINCVLVDEAQFLTKLQVRQLSDVCDKLAIPVLTYGLRTDFQGNLFEGSEALLAWADSLIEIKTICHCGSKATMVLRIDGHGNVIKDGRQVQIGGNDRYLSVCRRHFKEGMAKRADDELPLLDR